MTPVEYLYSLELHGIKLGLDNIRRLLSEAGDPQDTYATVHVGGTNGKGSVVSMLDAMLRAAGYTTGRFTSPHLCSVRERFLIGGEPIAAEALDAHIEYFRTAAERTDLLPTFFELNTAIAFRYFAERKVDIALIEVGMGGRFDSTNVITPEATAITNIALEHTQYLGETLEAIAFEKAGIIKPGVPVVVGETREAPMAVILDRADELGSPVSLRGREFSVHLSGPPFDQMLAYEAGAYRLEDCPLALPGDYQGANAGVAVRLAELLRPRFDRLTPNAVAKGLATVRWPCRLETVLESPRVIIDVAHNVAGAAGLARALESRCVLILAIANDKDAGRMIDLLASKTSTLILTTFDGPRALGVEELSARAAPLPHERRETLAEAIELGIARAVSERVPLVIAGSLFTAGEARSILVERYGASPLVF